MKLVVCIHRDDEAGVYFAHSDDLRGLVAEAATLDLLRDEVRASAVELWAAALDGHRPPSTDYAATAIQLRRARRCMSG